MWSSALQSVPDGLATGLLAGVNPIAGLNAYLVGTTVGALATSSSFMAIQGTGAMAMIVADVPAVHASADPARALFTLSVLTGVVMLVAGLLRLGSILRFVSNAVMVGFINAVGVNIILGQLADFTGYAAHGANRVTRALDTLLNPAEIHLPTLAVGVATIALIIVLERTRLKALGLVVAIFVASAVPLVLGLDAVATLRDIGVIPSSLPRPELPELSARSGSARTGALARVRRAGAGGEHLRQLPQPRRALPGRVAGLHGAGRGQCCGGRLPGDARRWLAVRRRRSTRPPAPDPDKPWSSRGPVMAVVIVAFGGLIAVRRDACARRAADPGGLPDDQAR